MGRYDQDEYKGAMPEDVADLCDYAEHYRMPYQRKRAPRQRGDELEGGTVVDCAVCKFAYYSIYHMGRRHGPIHYLPQPDQRICERCTRNKLFNKNIQNLKRQGI